MITSALDPQLVGEVLDLVRELKHQGATIAMATHEMSFAREVADGIVFLEHGVVVEQGPPVSGVRCAAAGGHRRLPGARSALILGKTRTRRLHPLDG